MLAAMIVTGMTASGEGGELTVESGLTQYQVVQCDQEGLAVLECTGTATPNADGILEARVVRESGAKGKHVAVQWTHAGESSGSTWRARIEGVPVGGPYCLELRLANTKGKVIAEGNVENLLVGDLWILAGQSNMHGRGRNIDVETPSDQVHVFAMNDTWRIAEEPLHRLSESSDRVHNAEAAPGLVADVTGWVHDAGLGLPFAKAMVAETGRPIGLIPCAHGGTSIDQWSPALKDKGGASLYGSMYRRFLAAGGCVRGVLWYQGENDTRDLAAANAYHDKFVDFVAAVRRDLGDPELPFYFAQLGRRLRQPEPERWDILRNAQLQAEGELADCGMVATIDLPLYDYIHISTQGLKTLGRRFAELAISDLHEGESLHGPRFARACVSDTEYHRRVLVTFTGVNGGLVSDGPVQGFSVCDKDGADVPVVYRQEIAPGQPDTVIVYVQSLPEGAQLWYGRGMLPICNVTDQRGLGLPTFGPVPIEAAQ